MWHSGTCFSYGPGSAGLTGGLVILEDFSHLNDSVIRSGQWGMAQHILLTVLWLMMTGDGAESHPWAHPQGDGSRGRLGMFTLAPCRAGGPVVARLRGWIWKQ